MRLPLENNGKLLTEHHTHLRRAPLTPVRQLAARNLRLLACVVQDNTGLVTVVSEMRHAMNVAKQGIFVSSVAQSVPISSPIN